MKKINKNSLIISVLLLAISSCSSKQSRFPTSIQEEPTAQFNFYPNSNLVDLNYSFKLLNFEELEKQKIVFEKHKIKSENAKQIKDKWILDLGNFISKMSDKIEFTSKDLLVDVKQSEFKKLKQALELIAGNAEDSNIILRKQIEIISAFNNNFRVPLEANLEILTLPFNIFSRLTPYSVNSTEDNSLLKIENSSFWNDPTKSTKDMAKGPSHLDLSQFDTNICKYNGPKTGYGTHIGFKIKCFDKKFKLKLAEVTTGPFHSRLYNRLGYNVPAINYLKNIKVKYDAKIFTELFLGKKQYLKVTLANAKIKNIPVPKKGDIRQKIAFAVLTNGTQISTSDFLKKIFPKFSSDITKPKFETKDLIPETETDIDYIVFKSVAVLEDTSEFEFGSWAYDELDHQQRSEIRALVLVGAWTGNYDLRKDNTSLQWNMKTGEIKHYISDPGTALSNQSIPGTKFNINRMQWQVTKEIEGSNEESPDYLINFRINFPHKVFDKLTLPEARWMVRIIAGISEEELTDALLSSGHSMSEMLLAREKMISIQQNMLETFGIKNEFPELMKRVINKNLNYSPKVEATQITLSNGHAYLVDEKNQKLINGELISPKLD